ncbi:MAG: MerR family transcriptional regulator [Candidatus Zixiibacteriota bacterium]|nr:MAG: MerR family transcriptional regulator [candidate division Zixibacteria bacterium]
MAKSTVATKRYYSISEVAHMTGLEAYVLRYWEKEFPILRPRKNRGGSRQYTSKDIELVNRIKHLRTKEKLTIAGARSKLMMKRAAERNLPLTNGARARTLIGQIRKDVEELLKVFS